MRRAAIVCPIRTPVGKFLGALAPVTAGELGATILRALVERTGIDPAQVDDVIFAQGYGNGEAPCIARWSLLAAGFPIEVPGYQLDRRCGSGLQAVIDAAMMVQTGAADVVIAGGVESMSNAEYYTTDMRGGARAGSVTLHDRLARGRVMSQPIERFGIISGMIETADNLARDYQISREECDEYAAASHQRAAAAWAAGKFDDEVVTVAVPQKRGDPILFKQDEGVRADATAESLGKLKPLEKDGVVTAGNASQQNDAAAACLVRGRLRALAHGHRPRSGGEAAVRPHGPDLGRHRPGRTQRGFRASSPGGAQRLGMARRWRLARPAQRQRLRHFARSPDRGHRRADPRQPAARVEAPRRQARPGDDVHRRRPGPGGGIRSRLSTKLTASSRTQGAQRPQMRDLGAARALPAP